MNEQRWSRRNVLTSGAAFAGLTWSAPVIRSTRVLQATGSEAPSKTTTNPPVLATYRLGGSLDGVVQSLSNNGVFDPACELSSRQHFAVSALLDAFGPVVFEIDGCQVLTYVPDINEHIIEFRSCVFTMTAEAGTLTGHGTGLGQIRQPWRNSVELGFDLVVVTGTGTFDAATGDAKIDGVLDPFFDFDSYTGTVTGTVTAAQD